MKKRLITMKEQNNELKKCPFCGGTASIREVTPVRKNNSKFFGCGGYYPMCNNCLTTGNNYSTYEKAAEAWNNRVEERR